MGCGLPRPDAAVRLEERIGLLNSDLSKNFKDTFIWKRSYNTGNGLQHDEHAYHDCQVVDAFARAWYTLESNDEDEKGWGTAEQGKAANHTIC